MFESEEAIYTIGATKSTCERGVRNAPLGSRGWGGGLGACSPRIKKIDPISCSTTLLSNLRLVHLKGGNISVLNTNNLKSRNDTLNTNQDATPNLYGIMGNFVKCFQILRSFSLNSLTRNHSYIKVN